MVSIEAFWFRTRARQIQTIGCWTRAPRVGPVDGDGPPGEADPAGSDLVALVGADLITSTGGAGEHDVGPNGGSAAAGTMKVTATGGSGRSGAA